MKATRPSFERSQMSLDVGAVAKGYATELVAKKIAETGAVGIINAGGNVRTIGKPVDGREEWLIGIRTRRLAKWRPSA